MLARHLGQEKPRTMAALTSLMAAFAREKIAGWQDVAPATRVHPRSGMEMGNHDAEKISAGIRKMAQIARRSTPDSKALGQIIKHCLSRTAVMSYPT